MSAAEHRLLGGTVDEPGLLVDSPSGAVAMAGVGGESCVDFGIDGGAAGGGEVEVGDEGGIDDAGEDVTEEDAGALHEVVVVGKGVGHGLDAGEGAGEDVGECGWESGGGPGNAWQVQGMRPSQFPLR
jgi:hypothetical protein